MAATNIPEQFKNKTFTLDGLEVMMVEEHYPNGRLCLRLYLASNPSSRYATITTDIPHEDPGNNAFFINPEGVNVPMLTELIASGVFINVRNPKVTAWKFSKGRLVHFENGAALEDQLVLINSNTAWPAKNVALGQVGTTADGKYLGRRLQEAPICPYCGTASEHVGGDVVYPHKPELADKKFWLCKPCDAYVGCHPGTPEPLGRLANAELRRAKMEAHTAFDKLWKGDQAQMRRADAYRWLAAELGIGVDDCHIGMFDLDACKKVIEVATQRLREAP